MRLECGQEWFHRCHRKCKKFEVLVVLLARKSNVEMIFYYIGVRLSALTPVADESSRSQATIESMINRLHGQKRHRADGKDTSVQNSSRLPTEESSSASQSEPSGTNATKQGGLSARNDKAVTSDEFDHNQTAVDDQTRDCVDDSSLMSSDFHSSAASSTFSGGKSISSAQMECPVCGIVNSWDLNELNRHVDICLNRSAVRDILTREKRTEHNDNR